MINKQNFSKYMCQFILVFLIHYNLSSDKDKYNSFIIAGLSATVFVYLDLYYPVVIEKKNEKKCDMYI
tara:strand:- start:229 stop:432 length:204 start_codon:yes stop_codon:yes gene_type:complete